MKITSMQKMIAVVVGFVILAVLAVVLLVLPMYAQIDTLAGQKADATRALANTQSQLQQLQSIKSRSADTEAQVLKIGTEMPDSPQLPTLIMELQDIANAAGVSVTSFSPATPTPAGGGKYTEISLNTQLTAKWADLLDYLHRLDKATRILRVTNITVSPTASDNTTETADEEVDLTVSLTTKAYVMGTNGVIGSTSSGTPGK
jgi:Tfp pilus assembly protein PilO